MKDINMVQDNQNKETNSGGVKKIAKKIRIKKLFKVLFVVVAIAGICGSVYFYNKYQGLKADPTVEAQKETNRLVSILGKLMALPQNETPTVATISDKEKLKDQVFFSQAENGDILFAYTTAMKAILYRPSINKIINVAPISINQQKDLSSGAQKTISNVAPSTTAQVPTVVKKK